MDNVNLAQLIGQDWFNNLQNVLHSARTTALFAQLSHERIAHTVYPPQEQTFNAFAKTPFNSVRVVILGQDPYHGPGQANGLAFSVADGIAQPPSLRNIFKELNRSVGVPMPTTGDLTPWAKQGVLLLNATLTVRAHAAGSHQKLGWEQLTDAAIKALSVHHSGLIFLLWGSSAQKKIHLIGPEHIILKAPHPSPLSAYRGFLGCDHFMQVNTILSQRGDLPIDWSLA